MNARTGLLLVGLLLFSVLPGLVHAEDEYEEFKRPGWYAGVGFNFDVHLFEDEVEDAVGPGADVDSAIGVNARGGYRFKSWLATELQYEYVEGFDVSFLGVDIFTIEAHTFTVNGKLIWPISRFQPFFLGGIGSTWYRVTDRQGLGESFDSEAAFAGRVGGGFDVYLSKNWVTNFEVSAVLTTHDLGNVAGQDSLSAVHYLSAQVGVQYRF